MKCSILLYLLPLHLLPVFTHSLHLSSFFCLFDFPSISVCILFSTGKGCCCRVSFPFSSSPTFSLPLPFHPSNLPHAPSPPSFPAPSPLFACLPSPLFACLPSPLPRTTVTTGRSSRPHPITVFLACSHTGLTTASFIYILVNCVFFLLFLAFFCSPVLSFASL